MSYFYDFNKNKVITREGINIQYGKAGRARGTERLSELNIYPILEPTLPEGMQVAKKLTAVDEAANRPVYVLEGNWARRVIDVMYCDEQCMVDDLIHATKSVQSKAFIEEETEVQAQLQGIIYLLERWHFLNVQDIKAGVMRNFNAIESTEAFNNLDTDKKIARVVKAVNDYETIDDVNPNHVIPDSIRADLFAVETTSTS